MKLKISLILLVLIPTLCSAKDFLCTKKYRNILREGPSFSSQRLRTLKKHTPLEMISYSNNWYEVKGINYKGYIYKTLISQNIDCMTILNSSDPYCVGKKNHLKRELLQHESFRIIKQELGCNYVKDKRGKRIWLSSTRIWPEDHAMLLQID